ncbi:DUF6197 family protein [Streptomyces hydrogenans]|uniref:Uncharacterized protein n=1 Tax=Streptomyces hydrogenans TaxID=1873719 RepID=A0ABQ3PJK1_9ACTN|nr:hypothetical protein [Streptomyces hydrogenans]GHG10125.1 hypothetical protein GCM10018784_23520 [Streptomyces hydrogenans]GHI25196.1 hypothetical protein Shyd_65670 [Streptomyces hydrogenans]
MTPEEILVSAGDIIRRDGWYQGETDDGDPESGAVCLMGAIGRAATGDSRSEEVTIWRDGVMEEANRAVQRVIDILGRTDVGVWNDDQGRTVEDVLLVLKQAAA